MTNILLPTHGLALKYSIDWGKFLEKLHLQFCVIIDSIVHVAQMRYDKGEALARNPAAL